MIRSLWPESGFRRAEPVALIDCRVYMHSGGVQQTSMAEETWRPINLVQMRSIAGTTTGTFTGGGHTAVVVF
jgi:hypothetical protein